MKRPPERTAARGARVARGLFLVFATTVALRAGAEPAVSFSRDIAPLLQVRCLGCHREGKPKGGYRMDSYYRLLRPGTGGAPSVTPGDAAASSLHRLLVATDPEDRMPQDADPLPARDIQRIAAWIRQGAHFDGTEPDTPLAMLVPRRYPAPDDTAGFPAPVAALAFSPDGQELAVGRRHAIAIRDTTNGALRRKLTNFPERIQALSWHPDGTALLVAGGVPGRSGEAVIVDARTGTMRALLLASTDVVMAAAFSPDGSQAAVADGANTVGIHDTVSGARIRFLPAHADWVMAIAWSADGHRILTSSRDRTARIADAMTGEGLASFTGHAAPVLAGVFTPDEKRAWTVGRDRNIRAWNTDNTDEGHHTFAPSAEDTFALASFSEGFLTAGADGRLRLHPWTAPEAPILHAGGGRLIAIAATSKAKKIAAGAQDGSVRLWDPGRAEPILYLPGNGGLERPRRDQ